MMLAAGEGDGRRSETIMLSAGTDEEDAFVLRTGGAARPLRNDPVSGFVEFVVDGMTVGGGIAIEARDPGGMTSVLLLEAPEPLRSAATDD